MSHLKVSYFDISGGRGEPIRLALHIGDIPFTDDRFSFSEWAARKPLTPYGSTPTLDVDGTTYGQSNALLRYAGRLTGLYPADEWEGAKIDEILDAVEDIYNKFGPTMRMPDGAEKLAKRKALAEGPVAFTLVRLEKFLAANGGKFFVGRSLSVADLKAFVVIRWISSGILDGVPPSFLDPYPHLLAHCANTAAHPKIASWAAAHNSFAPKPKPKLSYFDISWGRGEVARLAFTIAGIPFEDDRIPLAGWTAVKASFPFEQVPVLTVGGKTLSQSNSINRYVGKQTKLYPSDPLLAARADEVMDAVEDITGSLAVVRTLPQEQQAPKRAELAVTTIPAALDKLEARLGTAPGNGTFFTGELSVADLKVYNVVDKYLSGGFLPGFPTDIVNPTRFPRLHQLRTVINNMDKVKAFYAPKA